MNHDILNIARYFSTQPILSAAELGHGNINDTYLITDTKRQFVLQRLNPAIFADPTRIFENQLQLQNLLHIQASPPEHLHIPQLLLTTDGCSHYRDTHDHCWRGQNFIANGQEIPHLASHQGESVGLLLGAFHRLGQSRPDFFFHDILPGLHATALHIHQYNHVKTTPVAGGPKSEITFCHDCIAKHQEEAISLDRRLNTTIPKRLIHGDPKLANILFDKISHMACTLIDLDTIGPGFIHHDLADLIRSCCNHAGEESAPHETCFELSIAKKIISGYSTQTASFLTPSEVHLLGESLWVIPFELGIRFFTDYLTGSAYFKTTTPQQNLYRASSQFHLTTQIRQWLPDLQHHIKSCFK